MLFADTARHTQKPRPVFFGEEMQLVETAWYLGVTLYIPKFTVDLDGTRHRDRKKGR